jgi:hypothetical protein
MKNPPDLAGFFVYGNYFLGITGFFQKQGWIPAHRFAVSGMTRGFFVIPDASKMRAGIHLSLFSIRCFETAYVLS